MLERFKDPFQKKADYLKEIKATLKQLAFPVQIIVEPTAHCNLHCDQCGHKDMKRKMGNMSMDLFKKIIDEVAEVAPETEIWLAHYGESLIVAKNLVEFIRYATSKGVKNTFLNSNAMLLTKKIAESLHDTGLQRVIVGFDGFSKQVYESIRCGAKLETVKQNVLDFLELYRSNNWKTPELWLQFIVQDKNRAELDDFIKYWHSQGVTVKVRERLTWTGAVKAENLTLKNERIPCPWGLRTTAITWDGMMHICPADYEAKELLGDINKESIRENWAKAKWFREAHLKLEINKLPDICKPCQDWEAVGAVILPPGTTL